METLSALLALSAGNDRRANNAGFDFLFGVNQSELLNKKNQVRAIWDHMTFVWRHNNIGYKEPRIQTRHLLRRVDVCIISCGLILILTMFMCDSKCQFSD